MMTATSPLKFCTIIAAAAALFCLGGSGSATAASMPDTENGHYALAPVADGVLRLDTRTGAVSNCNNTGTGWACSGESFGSFSAMSIRPCETAKSRGLLTPHLPTTRASYVPAATSFEMVTRKKRSCAIRASFEKTKGPRGDAFLTRKSHASD